MSATLGARSTRRYRVFVHPCDLAEPFEESTPLLWQRTLTVNVTAAAELTRLALPALRAARGAVVFVNMVARTGAVPWWSAYVASKAALTQLADVAGNARRPSPAACRCAA